MPTTSSPTYSPVAPARSEIDALAGPLLLQFGVDWCGHCQAAEPAIGQALQAHPQLAHLRIEDGPGRALGRSFKVKLWPTLVLMVQGQEWARLVRPTQVDQVQTFLSHLPGSD
ncbi:MAG: thioredoxin family protein [Rhodoferax sp.]|nr:thioredoxin family protein [Rhodoferax sp.]